MSKNKRNKEVNSESQVIVFKNYHLKTLVEWLAIVQVQNKDGDVKKFPLMLHGPIARSRNKIVSILDEQMKLLEKNRIDIVKKHGELDKEGNPVLDKDGKNFKIKDQEAFDKDFKELIESEVIFDVLPSNKSDWANIKGFILNDMRSVMDFNETKIYEEVCIIFEKL